MRGEFTANEKAVFYGLTLYPNFNDREIAEHIGINLSTVTAIRQRLRKNNYFRTIRVPMLQNFGCELLSILYTNFNPVIPLHQRIKITEENIEVSEELFFSLGELEKGFSLSLSKDYTTIGKINDIRTRTFGKLGLLEKENPREIIFPFEISKIYRFFDFAPILRSTFGLDGKDEKKIYFEKKEYHSLSLNEKIVFCALVEHPEFTDKKIGEITGISRYTVSRMRRKFEENDFICPLRIPNIKKLGFEILAFYHILFDPRNAPSFSKDEPLSLMNEKTIFFACRQFEALIISIYENYEAYKIDKMKKMQFLKEKKWIAENPLIRTYSLSKSVIIKDFTFAPIARKILNCPR
ncbi:MAG: winged helix-turn-helix transcriptional regulator [Thermoplasmata archaeon]|nr:MAG: winged helix-turn-helix transcriptional regulator [Thermoplasmata archaeon]